MINPPNFIACWSVHTLLPFLMCDYVWLLDEWQLMNPKHTHSFALPLCTEYYIKVNAWFEFDELIRKDNSSNTWLDKVRYFWCQTTLHHSFVLCVAPRSFSTFFSIPGEHTLSAFRNFWARSKRNGRKMIQALEIKTFGFFRSCAQLHRYICCEVKHQRILYFACCPSLSHGRYETEHYTAALYQF